MEVAELPQQRTEKRIKRAAKMMRNDYYRSTGDMAELSIRRTIIVNQQSTRGFHRWIENMAVEVQGLV